MNLFSSLFSNKEKPQKKCPRCLGKGDVDWSDIKRLNKELKWIPGSCAYCNGSGMVDLNIEDNVAVDTSYLTNDLPNEERRKIIDGNVDALRRANLFEDQTDHFIKQICFLHFEGKLDANLIADFFLISEDGFEPEESERNALVDYVKKVTQLKKDRS